MSIASMHVVVLSECMGVVPPKEITQIDVMFTAASGHAIITIGLNPSLVAGEP